MKSDLFTEAEEQIIRNLPAKELLDLACELEIYIEEKEIERMELATRIVEGFKEWTRKGPLPISKYSREELEDFDIHELRTFFDFMGIKSKKGDDKKRIIDRGIRVCEKAYRKYPSSSMIAGLLPIFLPGLIRLINRPRE